MHNAFCEVDPNGPRKAGGACNENTLNVGREGMKKLSFLYLPAAVCTVFAVFGIAGNLSAQILIGHYTFDGDGVDGSGSANNLVPQSGIGWSTAGGSTGSTWFTSASPTAVFPGSGTSAVATSWFDGSAVYGAVNSWYNGLAQGENGLTLSFWFNTGLSTGVQYLFSESRLVSGTSTAYALYLDSGKVNLLVRTDTGVTLSAGNVSSTTFSAGLWYHVVFADHDGATTLYVNGALDEGFGGYTPDGALSITTTSLGSLYRRNASSTYGFNGLMGDFQVYDGALNAEQALQLYQTGAIPEPAAMALLLGAGALGLALRAKAIRRRLAGR